MADLQLVDENEGQEEEQEAPRRSASGRQKSASGRQKGKSGRQRGASGRQKGKSTSGSRRSASSGRHRAQREEPEFEDEYEPRRRSGPGFGELAKSPQIQGAVKGLISLAAAVGIGYFIYTKATEDKRPKIDKPPTVKVTPPPTDPNPPPTTDPNPPPTKDPVDPDEPVVTIETFIPEGALASGFEAVRDAEDALAIDTALGELALQDGVAKAAGEAIEKSADDLYVERMQQVLLRAGEPAERWERIQEALKSDDANLILHAVRAALDLELPEAVEALEKLEVRGSHYAAAVWKGAINEVAPEPRMVQHLKSTLKRLDKLGVKLLEPVLLWGGESDYLLPTAPWLGHSDERMLALARRALSSASGGSGPGEDASAEAWMEWAEGQGGARELYLAASSETDLPGAYAARLELVKKGPAALDYLPLFIRERAGSNEKLGAANMAAGLVRALGPGEPERVEAVLNVLTKVYSGSHGDYVVSAGLAVCDAEVAHAATKAMLRGACAQGQTEHLPALVMDPPEIAVGELSSVPNPPESRLILRALYRDRGITDNLFRGAATGLDRRVRAAALIAGDELDKKLQDMIANEAYPKGWLRAHALTFYIDAGTERSAKFAEEELVKTGGRNEQKLLLAVGTPEGTNKLRKKVEVDGQLTHMEAFGALLGQKCEKVLLKRVKDDDQFKDAAKQVLMRYSTGKKAASYAREIAEKFLAGAKANNAQAAPKDYMFMALANNGGKTELMLFSRCLMLALPRVRPANRPLMFSVASPCAEDLKVAEFLRGTVLPGKTERGLAAGALAGFDGELPNHQDVVDTLAGVAEAEHPNVADMAAFAALGVIDQAVAAERTPAIMEKLTKARALAPNALVGLACALTLAQRHAELREFTFAKAGAGGATRRECVARGIALAAQRRGETATAPPVLKELLLDGNPRVHAEAAVAAGFFGLDGALKHIGAAFGAPQEALDSKLRCDPEFALLVDGSAQPQSLRSALWDAYAVVTGEEVPVLERRWSLARGVEGSIELRKKALGLEK